MKRLFWLAACAIILVACGNRGDDGPPPSMESAPRATKALPDLAGTWLIGFVDDRAGLVEGKAIVSEDETKAQIYFDHPVTGEPIRYFDVPLRRKDRTLSLSLDKTWPGAPGYELPMSGLRAEMPGSSIALTLGEGKASVPARPAPSPAPRIEISLQAASEGLVGRWRQEVSPQTGRDAEGGGRIGDLSLAHDGSGRAFMSELEAWQRPEARIELVVPLNDQLASNEAGPAYPYPWDSDGRPLRSGVEQSNLQSRRLMVIGENLPTETLEPVTFGASSLTDLFTGQDDGPPPVEYSLFARQSEMNEPTRKTYFDEGWERARDLIEGYARAEGRSPDAIIAQLKQKDVLLVDATAQPGTLPGPTGIMVNGAEGVWDLAFGNFEADITFVRPAPGQFAAPLRVAYAPELVYVEIRSKTDMPFSDIPVFIGVNGEFRVFGATREILATRLHMSDEDRDLLEAAKAEREATGLDTSDMQVMHVWRTPPIALLPVAETGNSALIPDVPQGPFRIGVNTGDRLQATSAAAGWVRLNPVTAGLVVAASPAEAAIAEGAGAQAPNLTWPRAVYQAKLCAAPSLADDRRTEAGRLDDRATYAASTNEGLSVEAYTITEYAYTEIPWALYRAEGIGPVADYITRSIGLDTSFWFGRTDPDVEYTLRINVGDHAAMLMLRDVFVEKMDQQLAEYRQISSTREIEAFAARIRAPILSTKDDPIGDIEIPSPDGGEITYWRTLLDENMERDYGLTGEALKRYRLQAATNVLAAYIEAMSETRQTAAAIEACDVWELLELTSDTFDGIAGHAAERVMTFGAVAGREASAVAAGDTSWRLDPIAYSYIKGVGLLGDAARALEEFDDADTTRFQIAASIGTLGVQGGAYLVGYRSVTLGLIILGFDVVDIIWSLPDLLPLVRADPEIRFAQGAAVLLGPGRYDRALASSPDMELVLVNSVLTALGASSAIVEGPQLVSQYRKISEGNRLIDPVLFERYLARQAGANADTVADDGRRLTAASYDALSDADKELVSAAVAQAESRRRFFDLTSGRAGTRGLTPTEIKALALADEIRGAPAPAWAAALGDASYNRIRKIANRPDVRAMIEASPSGLRDLIASDRGRAILAAEPFDDIAGFRRAVEQDTRRIREPVDGVYADAGNRVSEIDDYSLTDTVSEPDAWETASEGYILFSRTELSADRAQVAEWSRKLIDARRINDPNLAGGELVLEMAYAKIEDASSFLEGVRTPLIDGRGTPTNAYMNVRAFHNLGIGFADPRLTHVKLATVQNVNTSVQLRWLEKQFGELPVSAPEYNELFSVKYAETALNQAGFRIKAVSVKTPNSVPGMTAAYISEGGYFTSRNYSLDEYLRKYGVAPDERITSGHDIYIEVEPITGARQQAPIPLAQASDPPAGSGLFGPDGGSDGVDDFDLDDDFGSPGAGGTGADAPGGGNGPGGFSGDDDFPADPFPDFNDPEDLPDFTPPTTEEMTEILDRVRDQQVRDLLEQNTVLPGGPPRIDIYDPVRDRKIADLLDATSELPGGPRPIEVIDLRPAAPRQPASRPGTDVSSGIREAFDRFNQQVDADDADLFDLLADENDPEVRDFLDDGFRAPPPPTPPDAFPPPY